MRLSLDRLRKRTAEVADRAAAGSALPAGTDPEPADPRMRTSARERGAMRRRLRRLRRRREAMLLELGALVFEMHRRGRKDPALVGRKAEEIRTVDEEAQALAAALDDRRPLMQVVATGIAGACPSCHALVGTDDRYCAACGTAVGATGQTADTHEPASGARPSAGVNGASREAARSAARTDAGS